MISKLTKPTKILILVSFICFSITAGIFAQYAPNTLTYQAVARNSEGKELVKTALVVQISILANEENGLLEWKEEHDVTTNDFGLFTLSIGAGEKLSGSATEFKNVDWGSGAHYLEVEINFGNGQFVNMGTTQMLAVPYALYAAKSGNSSIDFTGFKFDPLSNTLKSNDTPVADLSPLKQTLEFDQANYHLSISGVAGVIDLRQFIHAPQDLRIANDKIWLTGNSDSTILNLLPYKQNLSVNANSKLEISNGSSSVTIDTSNVNEIQGLVLNGNTLKVSTEKPIINSVDLTMYLDNTDNQSIRISSDNRLHILNGNSVSIDSSIVNEMQGLNLIDDSLKITNAPIIKSVSLKKYLDNTDNQSLRITSDNKLHILNSNSVSIDSSLVNELQDLSRLGDSIQITKGKSISVKDMINLSWVGFNCQKNSEVIIPKQSSNPGLYDILWDQVDNLNSTLSFESSTRFIVPSSGIYQISFNLIFDRAITVQLIRGNNEILREYSKFGSYLSSSLLLSLNSGDKISLRLVNYDTEYDCKIRQGDFASYRIH